MISFLNDFLNWIILLHLVLIWALTSYAFVYFERSMPQKCPHIFDWWMNIFSTSRVNPFFVVVIYPLISENKEVFPNQKHWLSYVNPFTYTLLLSILFRWRVIISFFWNLLEFQRDISIQFRYDNVHMEFTHAEVNI